MNIPLPTPQQLRWQEAQLGVFCHFGINTFHNKEWSAGQLDPASFNPQKFDAHQWVDVALRAGARYLVLTAKHHDGFCLWPTQTTAYSVASSPFARDVVGEVAAACHSRGLALGLYLSPWDRNCALYPDAAAYDAFYLQQMTELCTNYGELFEVWLDGAGSEDRVYNWDAIMAVVHRHQPNAVVFNMGAPTIRWVGNEDGLASDPCHYAVGTTAKSAFTGEVDALGEAKQYLPPECDVAIRRNWFWQTDDLATLKTREHLLGIWYRSIGYGANLLLNLGPNRDGLLDEHDVVRLLEVRAELDQRFSDPIVGIIEPVEGGFEVDFGREIEFDHLVLQEDIAEGQRVDGYRVLNAISGREVSQGVTIGQQKWHVFPSATARRLRVELGPNCAHGAVLKSATAYLTGHEKFPALGDHLDYGEWANKADARDADLTPWRES